MPLAGVRCIRGFIPMAEHQRCMLEEAGPPCFVEPSILQMMTRPNVEREKEHVVFSPSSLSSCHRRETLVKNHDWYLDVKQGYKMVRGTIIHQGMGEEPPYPGTLGVVRELRMNAPINTRYGEQTFHGKPDLVVLLRTETYSDYDILSTTGIVKDHTKLYVKIVDYKTVSEVAHTLIAPDRKHVYQVNEYGWLVTQFLPGYLNGVLGYPEYLVLPEAYKDHLFLNAELPAIDEVVVDELSIAYMDMSRTRTFSSRGFLYDQGKMLSDRVNGHWIRRNPPQYEELELEPIHQFKPAYVESLIKKGIETQIEAETLLAAPLTGDDARIMCRSCPVRQQCYDIGKKEGYSMEDQEPFVEHKAD